MQEQRSLSALMKTAQPSRLSAKTLIAAFAGIALFSSASANAQELRGTVMRDSLTFASGALVLLLDATRDSIVARTVTSERGQFSLKPPRAMRVRLRVLRVGFQPTEGGLFTLAAGEVQTTRLVLQDRRIALASFDVKTESRCEIRPDSGRLVAQLFEEARKALIGSVASVSDVRSESQFTLYKRTEDLQKRLTRPIERSTFSGPSWTPFASVSPDSLARFGYVVEEDDGTVYRAPDAGVLTSDSFLQAHCLQYVRGTGARAALTGISFRPVNRKEGLVDVTGTLWLDSETYELQNLEYSYVGLSTLQEQARPGGQVDYTQMENGVWFVNKWVIRMPLIASSTNPQIPGARSAQHIGTYYTGGEVQSVAMDNDVLYSNPGAVLSGSEPRDNVNVRTTAGRFEVESGAQVVVATPATGGSIDSLSATSVCGVAPDPGYGGIATGRISDLDITTFTGATVSAEWKDEFKVVGRNDIRWQVKRLETTVSRDGRYILCGLPERRPVTLTAVNEGRKSRVATVRLTDKNSRAKLDLAIGAAAIAATDIGARNAALFVKDALGNPIAHATVIINGGAARVTDNDGRLIVYAAPRDSLTVLTRRMGYQAFDGKAGRDSSKGAFQIVLKSNAQTLGTMTVRADATLEPLVNAGFYDRVRDSQRGALVGEFYTPEMIEARPSGSLSQFLAVSRWVSVTRSRSNPRLMVLTSPRLQCAMNLIVDGVAVPMDGSTDVNEMVGFSEVAAIEVYPTMANVPAAISSRLLNAACGVVVVWTGGHVDPTKPKKDLD